MDYSIYDPWRADPRDVPRSTGAEQEVLSAAAPLAAVAYETGLGYVLGKPTVIVARRGRPVPFDIDVEPVWLEDDGRDVERLIGGIQSALYGRPHGVEGNCLRDTIEYVRQRYGAASDSRLEPLLNALSPTDATRTRRTLELILERIDGSKPLVVVPTYAGGYPPADHRHIFHVTAFRDWSQLAQQEARAACGDVIEYRVGYEQIDPDILRSVWMDICRASFVLVDITNLNPNAVLELAIAQAIGRPTLVVTQNRDVHRYLPAIEKLRIHTYDPEHGRSALATLLRQWLAVLDSN